MLSLGVSPQRCRPQRSRLGSGRELASDGAKLSCKACGAPGGAGGKLLDDHIISGQKKALLCPLCHSCVHLDFAGEMRAGRIVWLPELSQEMLNVICLASFVAIRSKPKQGEGALKDATEAQALLTQVTRLYKCFEKRAEAVEAFLGADSPRSPMPRRELSNPAYVATLILHAKAKSQLSAAVFSRRLDGLRLLPDPRAFEPYINAVSKLPEMRNPLSTWAHLVKQERLELDAKAALSAEREPTEEAGSLA